MIMKEKIKAVLFDFDDTLSDREAQYRLYSLDFLARRFPETSSEEREKLADDMESLVEGGYLAREIYFPRLIEHWQWKNHPSIEELTADFNEGFGKFKALMPDCERVLEELKERGYRLGVISNGISKLQNTKLDTAGIRSFFEFILVSGDCEYAKPDPRIFLIASDSMNLKPEECVFVGDHPINDIKGAADAGMKTIRMNFGTFLNQGLSDDVPTITSLKEILEIL